MGEIALMGIKRMDQLQVDLYLGSSSAWIKRSKILGVYLYSDVSAG